MRTARTTTAKSRFITEEGGGSSFLASESRNDEAIRGGLPRTEWMEYPREDCEESIHPWNRGKSSYLASVASGSKSRKITIITVSIVSAILLSSQQLLNGTSLFCNTNGAGGGPRESYEERDLQLYMQRRRQALLNDSSVMSLGAFGNLPRPGRFFDDHFHGDMEFVPAFHDVMTWNASARAAYLRAFADPGGGDLLTGGFIDAMKLFMTTNGTRRHVVIANINENWGAFSEFVPNRTTDWSYWTGHWE